jgi:hypothetical protein
VPQRIEAWAEIIGLRSTDVRFAQFQEDVTEALHACMRAHVAAPYRSRWSDIRTDFMRVAEAARAVARHLDNLRAAFDGLPPIPIWLRDPAPMFKHLPLQSISDLEALASEADRQAEACKLSDKDSRPEMVAFATLAAVLAQALEHATGSSALDSAEFVPLVNAILPVVRDIAERTTGRRLAEPNSPEARRKYPFPPARKCAHHPPNSIPEDRVAHAKKARVRVNDDMRASWERHGATVMDRVAVELPPANDRSPQEVLEFVRDAVQHQAD